MIDWDVALAAGTRLARPGPDVSAAEARDAVEELRAAAERSVEPVRAFADLHADPATAPVVVVDRPGWIGANLASFEQLVDPVVRRMSANRGPRMPRAVTAKVSGAEVGALMAFMSGKVLGQFDPFAPDEPSGRLLLVAPNIVQVERALDVDPSDFRQWVCLHEETHRVQFTAVPWLGGHLRGLMDEFVEHADLDPAVVAEGLAELVRVLRGSSDRSLADLFHHPRQREIVDRVTGVMSLLEGHADVVMDGVGPEVVPTVRTIRRKFTQRRQGGSPVDRLVRRLLGLEGKMRQYRDGAQFVRGVVDQVGLDGFNAVWSEAGYLPSREEIGDPAAWVRRVHG